MNEKEFIMWLHGYLEISGATTLGEKELQVIKDHLNEFFVKVTPERHELTDDSTPFTWRSIPPFSQDFTITTAETPAPPLLKPKTIC
jgi:hypothetical protein